MLRFLESNLCSVRASVENDASLTETAGTLAFHNPYVDTMQSRMISDTSQSTCSEASLTAVISTAFPR